MTHMNTTINFKRRGKTPCDHGHVHATPDAAHGCNVAHRFATRAPQELVVDLIKAVIRGHERTLSRSTRIAAASNGITPSGSSKE